MSEWDFDEAQLRTNRPDLVEAIAAQAAAEVEERLSEAHKALALRVLEGETNLLDLSSKRIRELIDKAEFATTKEVVELVEQAIGAERSYLEKVREAAKVKMPEGTETQPDPPKKDFWTELDGIIPVATPS